MCENLIFDLIFIQEDLRGFTDELQRSNAVHSTKFDCTMIGVSSSLQQIHSKGVEIPSQCTQDSELQTGLDQDLMIMSSQGAKFRMKIEASCSGNSDLNYNLICSLQAYDEGPSEAEITDFEETHENLINFSYRFAPLENDRNEISFFLARIIRDLHRKNLDMTVQLSRASSSVQKLDEKLQLVDSVIHTYRTCFLESLASLESWCANLELLFQSCYFVLPPDPEHQQLSVRGNNRSRHSRDLLHEVFRQAKASGLPRNNEPWVSTIVPACLFPNNGHDGTSSCQDSVSSIQKRISNSFEVTAPENFNIETLKKDMITMASRAVDAVIRDFKDAKYVQHTVGDDFICDLLTSECQAWLSAFVRRNLISFKTLVVRQRMEAEIMVDRKRSAYCTRAVAGASAAELQQLARINLRCLWHKDEPW